jgi:hypothetical protein
MPAAQREERLISSVLDPGSCGSVSNLPPGFCIRIHNSVIMDPPYYSIYPKFKEIYRKNAIFYNILMSYYLFDNIFLSKATKMSR